MEVSTRQTKPWCLSSLIISVSSFKGEIFQLEEKVRRSGCTYLLLSSPFSSLSGGIFPFPPHGSCSVLCGYVLPSSSALGWPQFFCRLVSQLTSPHQLPSVWGGQHLCMPKLDIVVLLTLGEGSTPHGGTHQALSVSQKQNHLNCFPLL